MLVFITHPRYFEKKSLYRKSPELVYIFNSLPLYKELSKKFKCVNLDSNYNVKNENFFPEPNDKKRFKQYLVYFKKNIYSYFKKKEHSYLRKMYVMRRGFKDTDYNMTMSLTNTYEKQDINMAIAFLEEEIRNKVISIIEFEKGRGFVEGYKIHLAKIFNLMNSFYRSYIYSFCEVRGSEIYGDVFKFNNFLNAVLYYTFNNSEIYEKDFHYSYKKVLSRLFIEHIHKNDIKYFVKANVKHQKEEGWL